MNLQMLLSIRATATYVEWIRNTCTNEQLQSCIICRGAMEVPSARQRSARLSQSLRQSATLRLRFSGASRGGCQSLREARQVELALTGFLTFVARPENLLARKNPCSTAHCQETSDVRSSQMFPAGAARCSRASSIRSMRSERRVPLMGTTFHVVHETSAASPMSFQFGEHPILRS